MEARTITAKELQQEILSAQQELLREANELIQQADDRIGHAQRLQRIGFTRSSDAKVIEDIRSANQLQEQKERYALKYPGKTFIPGAAMDRVCNRYGLVIGSIDRYTGRVPAWAAKTIEENLHLAQPMQLETDRRGWPIPVRKAKGISEGDRVLHNGTVYPVLRVERGCCWCEDVRSIDVWGTIKLDKEPYYRALQPAVELVIAAPMEDMHLGFREMFQGSRIVPIKDDPIVCLGVEGGYIVLAAWGEEGRDPEVFNTANN